MAKLAYIEKRISADRLALIEQANAIIEEYSAKGFSLTLRQLYYQFVSRGLLANKDREYKRLGDIISVRILRCTCSSSQRRKSVKQNRNQRRGC